MSDIKFPKSYAQIYISDDLKAELEANMTKRNMTEVNAYLRQLISEDSTKSA